MNFLISKIFNAKGFLIITAVFLCFIGYGWVTSFTIVKKNMIIGLKDIIKADSANISILANELKSKTDTISVKDSLIAFQGDRIKGTQQLLKDTKIMLTRAENEAKTANEELSRLEENGFIQYYVLDRRFLKKDCYQKVDLKPDNICK